MSIWTLYKREMASYFQSMIAYILLACTGLVLGMVFYAYAYNMAQQGPSPESLTQVFFSSSAFLFILFLIQVPLITMRLFSEEFKMGTIEMLLTAPVTEWSVVMAKFLGSLSFFMILWAPFAIDLVALQTFTNPPPVVLWGELCTTFLTLLLIGSLSVSIGCLASVLSKNQIVSAIICFALLFMMLMLAILVQMISPNYGTVGEQLANYFSEFNHLQMGAEGVLDTRPIIFYLSSTILMLFCCQRILLTHRLQG
jgi:ABC-2 type transport system permease protein